MRQTYRLVLPNLNSKLRRASGEKPRSRQKLSSRQKENNTGRLQEQQQLHQLRSKDRELADLASAKQDMQAELEDLKWSVRNMIVSTVPFDPDMLNR